MGRARAARASRRRRPRAACRAQPPVAAPVQSRARARARAQAQVQAQAQRECSSDGGPSAGHESRPRVRTHGAERLDDSEELAPREQLELRAAHALQRRAAPLAGTRSTAGRDT
eukprot:scaffold119660_cov38-Phaeocystis_antarctica.AAC.2